ncbi:hypothetical protein [Undibacterium sp.]|uniref:hypothetical protein n=1 Tax=Undibacterium sp. TaxID=1914977 RepID=UPI00375213F4
MNTIANSKVAQPWMLRQKSAQLAAMTVLIVGDDFEELVDEEKDNIKSIMVSLAHEVRMLVKQLEPA